MPLLEVTNLSKSYGGVHALKRINLELQSGEVHALCGENGAGKSTLIKCLTGTVMPDAGTVRFHGSALPFGNVQVSETFGVAVMHQESTAFPDLNAVENIFVGREFTLAGGWKLDHKRMRSEAKKLMNRLGESIDLFRPLGELSVANRQMVSMARALSQDCRLLIMDEPTASLSARETAALLKIIRQLRNDGVTVLYVSHRLEELFEIADRVTVLRDGERVETRQVEDLHRTELIKLMVGRHCEDLVAPATVTKSETCEPILKVTGLTREPDFRDISLSVNAGEVVGLAGLIGAGRSEVARAIFGIDPYDSGSIKIDGIPLKGHDPKAATDAGIGLVPEDRQHEGLVLPMTVSSNLTFPSLRRLTRFGMIRSKMERDTVRELTARLQVKMASAHVPAETLSGGNQQKLVIGKWLATDPRVLILDEPTRGVDVGAKDQVHRLIRQLAVNGMAALLISSELLELISVCDRILVMREGHIVDELLASEATEHRILQSALPRSHENDHKVLHDHES